MDTTVYFQQIFGISGADASTLITWGWYMVVGSWALGYCGRIGIQLVKSKAGRPGR